MGWFDNQIKDRKLQDNAALEDAFAEIANSVSGKRIMPVFSDDSTKFIDSVNKILAYWHFKPIEITEKSSDLNEQLEYMLRPHGIMTRSVELKKGWYKTACGPMLGKRKKDGIAVAFIPNKISGYSFYDEQTGKKVKIGKYNEEEFEREAILFYKPFPQRKLSKGDFVSYVLRTFTLADFLIPIALLAAAAAVGVIIPKINHFMFSEVVQDGNNSLLISTAVFMLCLAVSKLLLKTVHGVASSRVDVKMSFSVQSAMMMRMLSLPSGFFREYSSGELYNRIENLGNTCRTVLESVVSVIFTALFSLIYITQIVRFAPMLGTASRIILLVTLLVSVVTAALQSAFDGKRMTIASKESGMLYSTITGIRKIKLAGAEKRAFARWANLYAKRLKHPPALIKFSNVINTAVTLTGTVVIYFLAAKSQMKVADFYAFQTAYGMIAGAFTALSAAAVSAATGKTVFNLAKPILDAVPETSEKKRVVKALKGNIELNNISFKYRDDCPNVIENLSFKIRSGEYVAIVGKTGCGKSTLVRLLLGFEKPQKGAVYYDGRDLSGIDLKSLRQRIGTVMQDGKLFAGSLYSNITISAPELGMEDAWAAAEIAGIAEDIRQMPMGMNTMVSESSGGFSGGQRQRLLIARAVASKPKILIFDEATSALDNITQKRVSDALGNMKCTRLVIAHRLSTIKNCDRILVLDGGRIAESGTYDELIRQDGIFAELIANQKLDDNENEGSENTCG